MTAPSNKRKSAGNSWAFERGAQDARLCRPPLFRLTLNYGIVAESDDPQADDWSDDDRRAYLEGFDMEEEARFQNG